MPDPVAHNHDQRYYPRAEADSSASAVVQAALADSPELGGTPTAPTAAAGTDTTQIATTAFVADASETNNTRSGASRKRSFVEKMISHRRPKEMWCRWQTGILQIAFADSSDKSIYYDVRPLDDCYVLYIITTSTHSESFSVTGRKNLTSRTGTWVDSGGSSYANTNGATAVLDFVGTGIVIQHYADHRGGIWSCVLDGAGDPYILDTYVPSGGPVKKTTLISDLPFGQHRLVCTLLSTPNPLNTSGQNRGWMAFSASSGDSSSTFEELGAKVFTLLSTPITVKAPSNFEFAIAARPSGTSLPLQWLPYHGVDTVFLNPGETHELVVDGSFVQTGETKWREVFEYAEIRGKYYGSHPDEPDYEDRLCNIDLTHRFTRDGLAVDLDIEWLRECDAYGYSAMIDQGFSSQLETDLGEAVLLPPVANVKLPGSPWVGSVMHTKPAGSVSEQAVWMSTDWQQNIDEIVRPDDTTNRAVISGETSIQWIAPTGKLYNQCWGGIGNVLSTIPAGTRQGWRIKIAAGYF